MIEAIPLDFAAVFEVTPTPSLVLDPDAVIVAVNSAYLRAVLHSHSELLGHSVFDVFPDNPDDPDAKGSTNLKASLHWVLQSAGPDTMAPQKYDVPAADGGFLRRWWLPVNIPLLDEAGQVQLILHRAEKITDYVDAHLPATRETAGAISNADAVTETATRATGASAGTTTATGASTTATTTTTATTSALRLARTGLREAESDLYARGRELVAALAAARRWADQQAGLVDIARFLGETQDEATIAAFNS